MRNIFLAFLLLVGINLTAQVSVSEEAGISALMNKYMAKNQLEESVKAWRIQIITTSDRREMQSAQYKFEREYPGMQMAWKHVPPYYKVTVGAWRDKLACDAFLGRLKKSFPLAIPVVDNISKQELLN